MSEAFYIFKATFLNQLKKKDIQNIESFFRNMGAALSWWDHNRKNFCNVTYTEFSKKFPEITKYINTIITPPYKNNDLVGLLPWLPPEDDLDEYLTIESHTVKFSGEQSTFLTMDGLANYFKSHFGATDARWGSDEFLDMEEILDMEAGNEIVEAILNQDDKTLPLFINIHPLLDAKIAEKLSKKV